MPGGNFDDVLKIDSDGHVSPRGPLRRADGEVDTELYIWVMQARPDGSGAFVQCEGEPSADGSTWTMKPGTAHHEGMFEPGQAIGMGSQTANLGGKTTVFAWSEFVELT